MLKLKEGWVVTRHLDGLINGDVQVFPLWETLFGQIIQGKTYYFVTLVTEEREAICLDIHFLSLSDSLKELLITTGKVKPKYFESPHRFDFDSSDQYGFPETVELSVVAGN
jgi:hypothetical protein